MKTWLITGCSSGLGKALAEAVLESGANAVVTSRRLDDTAGLASRYPETCLPARLDVRNPSDVEAVVKAAYDRFGRIDVLINNAGHGYRSAVEEGEVDAVRDLFETNFFGAVAMIKAVLPEMRKQRSGVIMNVTSIAARLSLPGSGYYSATKFALEGVSDALRQEVMPLGIKVLIVEPGAFRTDFSGRSLLGGKTVISDYAQTVDSRRKENDTAHGSQIGDPARAAKVLVAIAEEETIPVRLLLGSDAIAVVQAEVTRQLDEIRSWTSTSITTDFVE